MNTHKQNKKYFFTKQNSEEGDCFSCEKHCMFLFHIVLGMVLTGCIIIQFRFYSNSGYFCI